MELLIFNFRDELIRLDATKIVYFEGDGNYTHIVTINNVYSSVCIGLHRMEQLIAEQLEGKKQKFLRVGKRYIVNTRFISHINVLKQDLQLSDNEHFSFNLSVSKDALRRVKNALYA